MAVGFGAVGNAERLLYLAADRAVRTFGAGAGREDATECSPIRMAFVTDR
jgi:hypothetical protein